MCMIQGGDTHIQDCAKYEEEGNINVIFMLMIHLDNFKTTNIWINIILDSYMETKNGYYGYDSLPDHANDYVNMM